MAQSNDATWEAWVRAYQEVHGGLPGVAADVACPHCGKRTLRVAFMAGEDQPRGIGFFWCDSCLFGIGLSRTAIPDGIEALPFGLAVDELHGVIPNYTLVPPHFSEDSSADI